MKIAAMLLPTTLLRPKLGETLFTIALAWSATPPAIKAQVSTLPLFYEATNSVPLNHTVSGFVGFTFHRTYILNNNSSATFTGSFNFRDDVFPFNGGTSSNILQVRLMSVDSPSATITDENNPPIIGEILTDNATYTFTVSDLAPNERIFITEEVEVLACIADNLAGISRVWLTDTNGNLLQNSQNPDDAQVTRIEPEVNQEPVPSLTKNRGY